MNVYGRIDESPALRWTLRIWNGFCCVAAAAAFVLAILLLVWGGGDDDLLGDAIATAFAGLALVAVFVLGTVWFVGRVVLLAIWDVTHGLMRRRRA